MRALARALRVGVPDLYRDPISPPPLQDRPAGTAHSYERLRESLREAFPGIEYEADLERMAEQFVVELGWLQERTLPLEHTERPRSTLSAQELLELADSFYRYRMERWTQWEGGREVFGPLRQRVPSLHYPVSDPPLSPRSTQGRRCRRG